MYHIEYVPTIPEPYYQPTGRELQPRPVGEENGEVVYSYNPISAVNYVSTNFIDNFLRISNKSTAIKFILTERI